MPYKAVHQRRHLSDEGVQAIATIVYSAALIFAAAAPSLLWMAARLVAFHLPLGIAYAYGIKPLIRRYDGHVRGGPWKRYVWADIWSAIAWPYYATGDALNKLHEH